MFRKKIYQMNIIKNIMEKKNKMNERVYKITFFNRKIDDKFINKTFDSLIKAVKYVMVLPYLEEGVPDNQVGVFRKFYIDEQCQIHEQSLLVLMEFEKKATRILHVRGTITMGIYRKSYEPILINYRQKLKRMYYVQSRSNDRGRKSSS